MQSCMPFGIECGDGWYQLIDIVCGAIHRHCQLNNEPLPQFRQVKEKLGGLRIYVQGATDDILRITVTAMKLSYLICEECGSADYVTQSEDWIVTRCPKCMKKYHAWQRGSVWERFSYWLKSIIAE